MTAVHVVTVTGPEWLNSNHRRNRYAQNRIVQQWKNNARAAVKVARVPRFGRKVHIDAVLVFPDERRRDPANWYPTVKAVVDGLTDRREKVLGQTLVIAGVLADDDAAHVDGPDMRARVQPGLRTPTVELHIREVLPA